MSTACPDCGSKAWEWFTFRIRSSDEWHWPTGEPLMGSSADMEV
jgi:hypothetical protein